MTQRQIALEAAQHLMEKLNHFSASDLLVECWKRSSATFGLPGYQNQYPDARKMQNLLYGRKVGMLVRGEFEAVSGGYRMTKTGEKHLKMILRGEQVRIAQPPEVVKKKPEPGDCPGGCGNVVTERDRLAYGGRCEDCYSVSNSRG